MGIIFLKVISPWWSRSQNHRDISFPNISGDPVRRVSFSVSRKLCAKFDHKFESNRPERFESNGPFEPKRAVPQKRPQKSRSPIQMSGKPCTSENFPCKAFAAGKPCMEIFPTCKAFPYSVLNKGYLLNQTSSEENFTLHRPKKKK